MAQMSIQQAVDKLVHIMQIYEPRKAIITQLEAHGIRIQEGVDFDKGSASLGITSVLSKGDKEIVVESSIYQDLSPQKEMEGHYALIQDALFKHINQLLS